MLPPSKNMKQQEENVYESCLPTSQAEGKIGIFIMKRGRWLFDLSSENVCCRVETEETEETGRRNEEVTYYDDFLVVKWDVVLKLSLLDFCFSVSAAVGGGEWLPATVLDSSNRDGS